MNEWLQLGLLVAASYLIGSVPSGALIGMLMGKDLLAQGSGKTGTANSLRVLGRPAAAAVLVLDLVKGMWPVLVAVSLGWPSQTWLGLAAGIAGAASIMGHNRSLWVRLLTGKWGGGRGIVPALGAMLMLHPLVVLAALVAGGLVLLGTRYVAAAAVAGAAGGILAAVVAVVMGQIPASFLPGAVAWGLLVIAGFSDSLSRLAQGIEPRLGEQ